MQPTYWKNLTPTGRFISHNRCNTLKQIQKPHILYAAVTGTFLAEFCIPFKRRSVRNALTYQSYCFQTTQQLWITRVFYLHLCFLSSLPPACWVVGGTASLRACCVPDSSLLLLFPAGVTRSCHWPITLSPAILHRFRTFREEKKAQKQVRDATQQVIWHCKISWDCQNHKKSKTKVHSNSCKSLCMKPKIQEMWWHASLSYFAIISKQHQIFTEKNQRDFFL